MTFNYPTLRGICKTLKEEQPDKIMTVEDVSKIVDALTSKIEKLERELKNRR